MIDWKHINNYVDEAETILLTMRENPDGDGLGSATAMYYYLKEIKKDCRILNVSMLPDEYNFLNKGDIIIGVERYQIQSYEQLQLVLANRDTRPGDTIKLRIQRENEIKIVNLVLGKE